MAPPLVAGTDTVGRLGIEGAGTRSLPAGTAVTLYEVMGEPDHVLGGVHETVTEPLPGLRPVIEGGDLVPIGVGVTQFGGVPLWPGGQVVGPGGVAGESKTHLI